MNKTKLQNKKNDEISIYGVILFVIMFMIIGIIVLLILYYSGASSSEEEKNSYNTDNYHTNADTTSLSTESAADTAATEMTTTAAVTDDTDTKIAFTQPNVEIIAADALSELEKLHPNTVLKETTDAGQEYIDSIIFLGDSTTYGLISYKMLKDGKATKQVWTPVSGTLTLSQANISKIYYPDTETEIMINEAVESKKPPIMIITLGVNGVSFMEETYFTNEYKKLIQNIKKTSPDTIIILQSIFPVARSYAHIGSINNEKIYTANNWIVKIAEDEGVKYLNTYSVLVGEDGFLPEKYQNGDGMHLNEISFQIELNYIRTHAYME